MTRHRRFVWLARLVLVSTSALSTWTGPLPASAGSSSGPPQESLPPLIPREVVSLLGARPELWVTDDEGVLHFAGDTRALAGRPVDWSYRLSVSVEQLRGLRQGDPWLSTDLVSVGDAIYQPRWDTLATAPTLYRVQAPSDLPLFGITAENYETIVLPAAEWERRYGFRIGDLPQQALAPLTTPPAPPAPPAPTTPAAATAPATQTVAATATPAPPAPPAQTATVAPAAPPASTATVGPTTTARTLTGVPVYSPTGGDVSFTLPPGHDWTDVSSALATLARLMPTGTLQGESVLGVWRRAMSGGPYAYIEVTTVDLGPHPDVKGVSDLANLKLRFLRNDSDAFQSGSPLSTTVGGQPAIVVDLMTTRRFASDPAAPGHVSSTDVSQYVTQRNPDSPVTELIWSERAAFTIRGSWGYVFRLVSTGPGVKSANESDLSQLLASLSFNY